MSLDQIINIQIDRQTTAVTKKGFGSAMVLVEDSEWPGADATRIQQFTDVAGVTSFFGASTLVEDWATSYFGQESKPEVLYCGHRESGGETVTDALNAIENVNSDWYALALISKAEADILAAAAWTQARRKIYGYSSEDADILTTAGTSIGDQLFALGYDRTFGIYNSEAAEAAAVDAEHSEAAWMGLILPENPGSVSWKFKQLAGVTVSTLTTTEKANASAQNVNTYTRIGGVNITEEGVMASGEFIDVIRGIDWLHARMQERIYSRLVNLPKVPYTTKGIDTIVGEVTAQLTEGVRLEVLADDPAPFVTAPDINEISSNDKALRVLPDINFEAVLAGAIHKIIIKGVVKA